MDMTQQTINTNANFATMKKETVRPGKDFDINRIKSILPHRDPFLLIDHVDEVIETIPGKIKGRKIIARRDVSADEYYFKGHFPGNPLLPGVLMVEILAQTAGFGIYSEEDHGQTYDLLFLACEDVKFRKAVRPGTTLIAEVDILLYRKTFAKFKGVLRDETGDICCEAVMKAATNITPKTNE